MSAEDPAQNSELSTQHSDAYRRARERARTEVYERLALLSAVIWVAGSFLLFVTIVPFVPRPQAYIAIAITLPLIAAALPWLFYSRLSEARARRLMEREGEGGNGEG